MGRRLVLFTVALATLTACSSGTRSGGPATVTMETVKTGTLLAQVNGHHLVALELYKSGDRERALVHAGHPVVELLSSLEPEIAEHDRAAASELKKALEAMKDAVAGGPLDAVTVAADAAALAVRNAERAVAGDAASSDEYRGSIVAGLLGVAAHEYEEAVSGGKVSEMLEYQDAFGFTTRARRIYADVAASVKSKNAEGATEIDEAFASLAKALPSPAPPAAPVPHEDVKRAAGLIAHELEEIVGALVVDDATPEEIFDRIDALLTRVVDEYGKGEKDEAAELVAQAYLENYELVEADVIRNAKAVNDELEPLLGSQLRARIKAGGSIREITALVDHARDLLAKARAAVEKAS